LYTASGKPVDARVSAALNRQDALIIAALDAAERRGTPAVVRRTIQETIG
jgi:hypothetical protein